MKNFMLTTLTGAFIAGKTLTAAPSDIVHKTEIHAGASTVWHVLTNFPDYQAWNTWIDSLGGEAIKGQTVLARVNMGGFSMQTVHKITVVKPLKQLCWEDISWFTFLVGGTRCRTLKTTQEGNTVVENRFRFSGVLQTPGGCLFESRVSRGMKKENEGLKAGAEELDARARG